MKWFTEEWEEEGSCSEVTIAIGLSDQFLPLVITEVLWVLHGLTRNDDDDDDGDGVVNDMTMLMCSGSLHNDVGCCLSRRS